ncbi:N-acetyltransferase [Nocardia sp. CNY236]|uniref:GNAT family N-acetyltransferase n=1 Tax=Nocardia sp. CNY236 TaxID=1169152 RepID=UPI000415C7AA|nr:GNAT family N-acetyltransferase [Nocardia sp. CNY236]
MTDLQFNRYDAYGAREQRALVEDVYRRSYRAAIASGDPFDQPAEFMKRFDAYTDPRRSNGFELVVATIDRLAVGQTWGWPLGPSTAWWGGLVPDEDGTEHGEFVREDGARTFALSEIMIDEDRAGQGIAHALHDELLAGRTEERATLLVEPDNPRAYRAYLRWGWSRRGELTPSWPDAPTFDVLIRTLTS